MLKDYQVLSKKKRVQNFWFVLQDADYQLFSDSVMNELLLGLDNTQANRALAAKLLQELGLEQVKDQHPTSLSGGPKAKGHLCRWLDATAGFVLSSSAMMLNLPYD